MAFEDRQREAMTDFNRSSYSYVRELLAAGVKRAQDEADFQRFQLEEYERANGFRRAESNVQKAQIARLDAIKARHSKTLDFLAQSEKQDAEVLDASRAYREVTGRDAFAGAETYTRRNAEDIHD
jgi:hypothetical protein